MGYKKILQQATTIRDDIADLVTRRALPTPFVRHLDPFLFLNHHGPQTYPPNNDGLPFGPHPHRGFETVTFILSGELSHEDTGGHSSRIHAGGVQWMTAGSGLIHSEISSTEFQKKGGALEILQLWVNLPAKFKMTSPKYVGLQKDEIPILKDNSQKVSVQLVSGEWQGKKGPFTPLTDIHLMVLSLEPQAELTLHVPEDRNVFFYVIRGDVDVNGQNALEYRLIEFSLEETEIILTANKFTQILFGHAKPYREPIVSHGPFVMNTREEIFQAIQDYQSGKIK